MFKLLQSLTKKLVADRQAKQLAKVRHEKFLNIMKQIKDI